VDHLSRQLSRDAADTHQVAQDRETLLEELRAAQQVGCRRVYAESFGALRRHVALLLGCAGAWREQVYHVFWYPTTTLLVLLLREGDTLSWYGV
jgi:hypothetical protein